MEGIHFSHLKDHGTLLAAVVIVLILGAGCSRGGEVDYSSANPQPTTSVAAPSPTSPSGHSASSGVEDLAGFYESCTDSVAFSILSPDQRWKAAQVCDRTVLQGPGVSVEWPGGYPVSFSPKSNALLFVSTGQPIETVNKFGRALLRNQPVALYVVRLPTTDGASAVRLTNQKDLIAAAEPSPGNVTAAADDSRWLSDTIFQYSMIIPSNPEYSGIFQVNITPTPTVSRAH